MSHLHIHVISIDSYSDCIKNRKHYNSFKTNFFVELEAFPLAKGDERRHLGPWHKKDFLCWRCGRNFKNQFKELKEHLAVEFEAWKRE
jgi:aprataxin